MSQPLRLTPYSSPSQSQPHNAIKPQVIQKPNLNHKSNVPPISINNGVYYLSLFDLIYFSLSALSKSKDNSTRVLVLVSMN
ncbi:hypothetical protein PGT21_009767 [Puccinia graminis f. sp. tritici]|uniref:Uncharacterized protein n=1 Tax=Puccinia graminis f. sp. tritici TaxID=56615 RepID=A0A5B0MKI8_PUCGR|nr:hypothetical protein PGT21_009767 [Puccinia graminis f. sp. tritici]